MTQRTHPLRSLGPWGVLLALIGMWLSHTAEVVLVGRHHGLGGELWEPADMLPMGAALAVLAAASGARLWWLWLRLSRRLDVARHQLRALWRNHQVAGPPRPRAELPSASGGTLALWIPLAAVQLGLYVAHENIEALLDGGSAPGLRPLIGLHRAAPLVHAAVALALAWAATAVVRRLRRGQDALRRAERLVARGVELVRRSSASNPAPAPAFVRPPLRIHGHVLWCRPPPAAAAA